MSFFEKIRDLRNFFGGGWESGLDMQGNAHCSEMLGNQGVGKTPNERVSAEWHKYSQRNGNGETTYNVHADEPSGPFFNEGGLTKDGAIELVRRISSARSFDPKVVEGKGKL